jgi:ParE toxin of type II toxin-antitoxin system, parDE
MRRDLVISDSARADLDSIYDHIAADSPESAERFIARLVADLHRIARLALPAWLETTFGWGSACTRSADTRHTSVSTARTSRSCG